MLKTKLLSTRGGIGGRGRLMICLACRELCSWDSGIEAAETRDLVTQPKCQLRPISIINDNHFYLNQNLDLP